MSQKETGQAVIRLSLLTLLLAFNLFQAKYLSYSYRDPLTGLGTVTQGWTLTYLKGGMTLTQCRNQKILYKNSVCIDERELPRSPK